MKQVRTRRFWIWLGLLFGAQAAVVALCGLLLRLALPADERAAFDAMAQAAAPVLLYAALVLLAVCGLVVNALLERYPVALQRLSGQARVLLTSEAAHPVQATGAPEIEELAAIIDRLGNRWQDATRASAARSAAENQRLREERDRLAALMSDLVEGVIVCNADGRVLLYNQRAAELLARAAPPTEASYAPLGLGRSVFGLFDRDQVVAVLEGIQQELERGTARPHGRFAAPAAFGALRVRIAPFLTETRALAGLVFALDDAGAAPPQVNNDGSTVTAAAENGPAPASPERIEAQPSAQAGAVPKIEARPEFYDFDLFESSEAASELAERPLASLSYTAFDTETTGLQPSAGDEIISIGAVRIVNGRLLRRVVFDQLVDPRRPIGRASLRVHGIDAAALAGAPPIEQVLPRFRRFCEDAVLVGHNAAFDLRFFELKQGSSGVRFDQPVLDTLLLAALVHPHHDSHDLDALAARLGVSVVGRHTALGDALVTGEIFLRLLPLLAEHGIVTLGQALEASRATYLARLQY
jgi:DNA polymerase III epsilon subunit family exonuclease